MEQFKPNVDSIHFIFSDRMALKTFVFPWYVDWADVLRPILDPILKSYGVDDSYINRLQLAIMNPGSEIKTHVDRGPWVKKVRPSLREKKKSFPTSHFITSSQEQNTAIPSGRAEIQIAPQHSH